MIKLACATLFKLSGWKFEGQLPEALRSFIFLGAPHTSNYDFVPAMSVAYFLHRNAKFVIKDDWMKFPLNLILGPAGAIGLDRKRLKEGAASNTDAMAELFKKYPELVLMIAPEATRSPNENWKPVSTTSPRRQTYRSSAVLLILNARWPEPVRLFIRRTLRKT